MSIPTPAGGRYARLVLVLGLLSATAALSTDTYLPAFPAMARDLAATESQVQATLAGSLIGLGLGQIVTGPLSDALGRRRPVLVGVTLHIVASLLCAIAPNVSFLIAFRLVQGLAGTAGMIAATAVVRDLFVGRRAAVLYSRMALVMGLTPVIAPTVGGFMLAVTSWRGVFLALAVIGVVMLVLTALWLPETLPPQRRHVLGMATALRAYGSLFRDPVFLMMIAVVGLASASIFTYVSASPFVLQNMYGMSAQSFGLVFGGVALSIVAMSQVNPLLLARFGIITTQTLILATAVVSVLVMLVVVSNGWGGWWGYVLPLVGIVGGLPAQQANSAAMALHHQGAASGTASAMLGAARFGVGGLATPLVGLLLGSTPVPSVVMLTVTTGLGLALFLLVRPRLRGYLQEDRGR
ncbi:MFS transporter, DHA1 family, bicyclomycin/chloramphenicol resistance protein [Raineyella antarctica]|uniref:MFS transporter, DHA1 family, bicyclomycin/chloramphenicol resistance protein n=1 Tax=Raineyella antarctica TaxID=1577474 RepID=A0A1G6GJ02_9ACTN|nr:multidrug effflux MFS transporter [Raineyella antarctica]SDB81899.1 MFS transporter, DHA1 family, bicyclomycin/chloramphenicol resistance protein [Raineyella antarctica]